MIRLLTAVLLLGTILTGIEAARGSSVPVREPSPFRTNSKPTLSVILADPEIWARLIAELRLSTGEQVQLQAIIHDEMTELGRLKEAADRIAMDARPSDEDKRSGYRSIGFNERAASITATSRSRVAVALGRRFAEFENWMDDVWHGEAAKRRRER